MRAGKVTKTEKFLLGITAVFLCLLAILYGNDTKTEERGIYVETERVVPQEEIVPAPLVVDLNTADAEELGQLPGIGPELANRIVAYREEQGAFEKIEEIMNVKGIGQGKFEAIAEMVTAERREAE